jgi:hypothetical protein
MYKNGAQVTIAINPPEVTTKLLPAAGGVSLGPVMHVIVVVVAVTIVQTMPSITTEIETVEKPVPVIVTKVFP